MTTLHITYAEPHSSIEIMRILPRTNEITGLIMSRQEVLVRYDARYHISRDINDIDRVDEDDFAKFRFVREDFVIFADYEMTKKDMLSKSASNYIFERDDPIGDEYDRLDKFDDELKCAINVLISKLMTNEQKRFLLNARADMSNTFLTKSPEFTEQQAHWWENLNKQNDYCISVLKHDSVDDFIKRIFVKHADNVYLVTDIVNKDVEDILLGFTGQKYVIYNLANESAEQHYHIINQIKEGLDNWSPPKMLIILNAFRSSNSDEVISSSLNSEEYGFLKKLYPFDPKRIHHL
jgi:hypothetical protein